MERESEANGTAAEGAFPFSAELTTTPPRKLKRARNFENWIAPEIKERLCVYVCTVFVRQPEMQFGGIGMYWKRWVRGSL